MHMHKSLRERLEGRPGTKPELFSVTWAPVWQRDSPVTGFRTGRDSTFIGSTPTIAMPQDERTAALLLLGTSTFIHLSGSIEAGRPVVRGADEDDDGNYRFLEYSPRLAAVHQHGPASRSDGTVSRQNSR